MAYTSSDLASVQAALLALASGTRVVSASISDKTIEYSRTDLSKLESLRNNIIAEINSLSGRSNCILIKTSKGL